METQNDDVLTSCPKLDAGLVLEAIEQLNEYILSRDRVRKQIMVPSKYAQIDLIAFSLNVVDILELE